MIWYDEAIMTDPTPSWFDATFWQSQNRVVGSALGRGTTWFVQLDGMQAALRHYRRGGLFAKLVSDDYWFSGWEQTRCAQELRVLETLIEAGVNVPRPVAAQAVKGRFTYRADLLCERIPNARDLVAILQDQRLEAEMYRKIGDEIRKMHQAQVNHTDLNIHNILIDDKQQVWLIDFDKCHQQAGDEWKQGNWARLKRSFEKELKKRQIHWSADEFEYLL